MTRHMHLAICSRKSWDTFFQLSKDAIVEINFWKLNCMFLPFKTILKEYVLPKRIIYTDASDHAGNGYCLQILGKIVHRGWTAEDSRRSSTWRELKAMELTLDSFKVETLLDFLSEVHSGTLYFTKKKYHSALLCYE